jgi:peroxiredoxin
MIANNFISANKPFIPEQNETVYEYIKGKKENYFNSIELDNPVLQSSGFLTDKLTNYVFTALPLEPMSEKETENAIKENVNTVNTKMTGVSEKYKLHLFYSLWSQAAASNRNEVSDYIYNTYLKALAKSLKNQNIIDNIEVHNRLRIGAIAPDIQWKKGTTTNRLKSLTGAENYVLVFWSSTCGHCLNELPALHKELLTNDQVKVIAVGLEDNEINWKREAAKMDHFEHAIALGKWQSDYAKLYAVLKTPTYFVLDKDKHIIAKPEDDKAVVEFLTNN